MRQPNARPFEQLIHEQLTRRRVVRNLAALAATSQLHVDAFSSPTTARAHYAFEEVPASSSGITWVHTAGKSADKHLPETSGAGCAFLDFDNDGWMDIYLVNSGKSDFYNPPRPFRNALYRNNRDGTLTDATAPAGLSAGG